MKILMWIERSTIGWLENIYFLLKQGDTLHIFVSMVSQFMHSPRGVCFCATYKILHYVKSTPSKRILIKKNTRLVLEAYNLYTLGRLSAMG